MSPKVPDAVEVALIVVDVLERLGIAYQIGGSFASSVHGNPRQTNDIDLVLDLHSSLVGLLVRELGTGFYFSAERIRDAVRRRSSSNLLHLRTGVKVDLFMAGPGYEARELDRSVLVPLPGRDRPVRVKSPEDTVLRKLLWYRDGGEVSDRQWSDVVGVLENSGGALDWDYLRRTAVELEVDDLLARAVRT